MTVDSTFVINPASVNDGKLLVEVDLSPSPGTNIFVALDGPYGTVRAYPGSPDSSGTSASVAIDLPVDANGDVLTGDYTVKVKYGPFEPYTEYTSTFCYLGPTTTALSVGVEENCNLYQLVATDNTSYPNTMSVTRSWTVQHPVIANTTTPADSTSTAASILVSIVRNNGLAYRNVNYQVLLVVTGTETVQDTDVNGFTWYIEGQLTSSQEYTVSCGGGLCGEFDCVDNTIRALLDKACSLSSIAALPKYEADKLALLQSALTMYNHAYQCGDWAAAKYYKELIDDINGDCPQASVPQAINSSPVVSQAWVDIPSGMFLNSYAPNISYPLQYAVHNNVMFFRGKFDGNAFVESGLAMVDASYWTDLGLSIPDRVALAIIDANTNNSPTGCVGFAQFLSNELTVYFTSATNPAHLFQLSGSIPLL